MENNEQIRKILYIGKDQSYYDSLQEKYRAMYPSEEFDFMNLCRDEEGAKPTLLHRVSMNVPDIIYVDYSLHTQNKLILARNLSREYRTKKSVIMGLLENLDSKETLISSLSLGIYLNLIKGAETTNAVHHPMCIAFPDIAVDADYALAKNTFSLNATTLLRLSYLTNQYLHVEGSFNFEKGVPLKIISNLGLEKDLSHNYIVAAKDDYNIYSNYDYCYDLKYDHMDAEKLDFISAKIESVEQLLKEKPKDSNLTYELDERNAELTVALQEAEADAALRPGSLDKWIKGNSDGSLPKRSKILIIDKDMNCLYESANAFDSFPFSIQLHSGVDKDENIVHRVQPGLIAINFDLPEDATIQNTVETLEVLIGQVKKESHLDPIVLVFNCSRKLEELKKTLDYQRIIASPDKISFDFIKSCLDIYEEHDGRSKTHNPALSNADQEDRVYLGKHDPKSILQYTVPIEVTYLSETDLIFNSEVEIPLFTSLYIKSPVKMTITVVPFKKVSKRTAEGGEYYALINGIGEMEMTTLRKYVNDLIFKSELKEKD